MSEMPDEQMSDELWVCNRMEHLPEHDGATGYFYYAPLYKLDPRAEQAAVQGETVDPDMPAQQLRLHMGELTANEMRVARAAIRWANSRIVDKLGSGE